MMEHLHMEDLYPSGAVYYGIALNRCLHCRGKAVVSCLDSFTTLMTPVDAESKFILFAGQVRVRCLSCGMQTADKTINIPMCQKRHYAAEVERMIKIAVADWNKT